MSIEDARDAAIDRLRSNPIVKGSTRFKDIVDLYLAASQWRPKTRFEIAMGD